MNTIEIVTAIYDVAFDRKPDAAGLAHHVAMLESGDIDIAGLCDAFAASQEYGDTRIYPDALISDIVTAYQYGLDRSARVDEQLGWLQSGAGTGGIICGVALSEEYANLTGTSPSAFDFSA